MIHFSNNIESYERRKKCAINHQPSEATLFVVQSVSRVRIKDVERFFGVRLLWNTMWKLIVVIILKLSLSSEIINSH